MELILSEHTSSCLICDEQEGCKQVMPTIRKAGVTTGCRYCPNDDQCELEQVVKYLGIKEIPHPVSYRGLGVEKEDPFYDRDYNLCIYCGRCVRVCQEVRLANVLAFNQRGRNTVIGPAFGRSHVEAGCEFCGSCVSICPTGSLAEKYSKWDGVPDLQRQTTCALCGVGCQLDVKVKNNKVIGTAPAENGIVNQGELCLKGRFCVPELMNHHQRLTAPTIFKGGIQLKIAFDDAIEQAAERLKNCEPAEFAMLVSPNCTNEDLYVAQKFTRLVMKSSHIDCSTRWFYGNNFNAYLKLFSRAVPLEALKKSSTILAFGLDLQYGKSVVGYFIRRVLQQGCKVITINPDEHSLALTAEIWIRHDPGEETVILDELIKQIKTQNKPKPNNNISEAAKLLTKARNPVILVGNSFYQYASGKEIFNKIFELSEIVNGGILPLPAQSNLLGTILMGAYPELYPGGTAISDSEQRKKISAIWNLQLPQMTSDFDAFNLFFNKKVKMLYLIGETLPVNEIPAEFIIYQNIYPPQNFQPNIRFPSAAFTETAGSFINGEGRVQRTVEVAPPPDESLPDWKILCLIAQKMGAKGFDFKKVTDIQKEISQIIPEFSACLKNNKKLITIPPKITLQESKLSLKKQTKKATQAESYLLTEIANEHIYRGIPLSEKVDGLKTLIHENSVIMSQSDAEMLHLQNGNKIKFSENGYLHVMPVHISDKLKPGSIKIIHSHGLYNYSDPKYVTLEKADV